MLGGRRPASLSPRSRFARTPRRQRRAVENFPENVSETPESNFYRGKKSNSAVFGLADRLQSGVKLTKSMIADPRLLIENFSNILIRLEIGTRGFSESLIESTTYSPKKRRSLQI